MEQYIIPNLSKACHLLSYLADHPDGVQSSELEKVLDVPKTTLFRILKTLCSCLMVEKRRNLFFAGNGLVRIGLQSLNGVGLREMAVPILYELTKCTQQTSHIALPNGFQSMILEVCDSPNPIRVASRAGTLVDLYCSSTGKVFLAYLYAEKLEEYFETVEIQSRTKNTITKTGALQEALLQIVEQGYALDDQEYHTGVRCLAAPVFDMNEQVVSAIGITGPASDITPQTISILSEKVKYWANKLSNKFGYKV